MSVLVHHLNGHQDWTTLSRIKGGVKCLTNPETPCSSRARGRGNATTVYNVVALVIFRPTTLGGQHVGNGDKSIKNYS